MFCENFKQTAIAEQQRDEALSHVKALKDKLDLLSAQNGSTITNSSLRGMSLQKLKTLQVSPILYFFQVELLRFFEILICLTIFENGNLQNIR